MARRKRVTPGGFAYHAYNRGARKGPLFREARDYIAFLHLLCETRELRRMRILAYCLMPNHWHLLLWPFGDRDMSRFMHRLTTSHASYWRWTTGTCGEGAVYQGRFGDVAIEDYWHLLTTWRYIERNPIEAGLVERVEDWNWSSAAQPDGHPAWVPLDDPPLPLPANWRTYRDSPLPWEFETL